MVAKGSWMDGSLAWLKYIAQAVSLEKFCSF